MDIFTSAIIAIITGGATKFGEKVVNEAYELLKLRTSKIFGQNMDPMKSYYILSKHNKKCLDVSGWRKDDSAQIQQYRLHKGNNQRWQFVPIDEHYFAIMSRHSHKCLDVSGWRKEDSVPIQQYALHCGDNQLWELVPAHSGYYQIRSKYSGKCLDVSGWKKRSGTRIQQYDFHGGDNQLWKIVEAGKI
ncbi:RICIN domain-containing protein [Desulfococcaceae bacterium HSG9]|nr:RICIN domain-containing protein [Desulfococcaceae bacterium HSG9]